MISSAMGASGSVCGRLFFVRSPGKRHTPDSMSISLHRMPQTSIRRQPVSNKSLTILLNAPASSQACQIAAISAFDNTRSRGLESSGLIVPTTGFASVRPCPIAHA